MRAHPWFERARLEGFAIGAFNVGNLVTLKAVVQAAERLRAPVIIEASHGEVSYIGVRQLASLVATYRAETGLPIMLNLDHAPTSDDCFEAMTAGFDYLHIDASKESYEKNVTETKKVVQFAHPRGRMVEAELDHITGSSELHKSSPRAEQLKSSYTDPDAAAKFVKETGVDTLAAFIGNVHGLYSHSPKLDLDRLRAIRQATPAYLSLHGGSGISDDQVREAVRIGIDKVNVNSELRLLFRQSFEQELKKHPDEIAMYNLYPEVVEALSELVVKKIRIFGSEGRAS